MYNKKGISLLFFMLYIFMVCFLLFKLFNFIGFRGFRLVLFKLYVVCYWLCLMFCSVLVDLLDSLFV